MGILQAGLVGQIRKKAGNFVFSNWKGINTARAYAIPANPDSPAQRTQRSKFKAVVQLASSLLSTLIVTFWNPFAVGMSGFNSFCKSIFPNVTSAGLIQAACKVTKGTLEPITGLTAVYTAVGGNLQLQWDTDILGNGLATDSINFLVINNTTNAVVKYEVGGITRTDGAQDITLNAGLTAAQLTCFAWASRGSGSDFMVSESVGDVASA